MSEKYVQVTNGTNKQLNEHLFFEIIAENHKFARDSE